MEVVNKAMNNTKSHGKYNDVIWYDEALRQMPALMPAEESSHIGSSIRLENVTEADIYEDPEFVCTAFLEAIKLPGRDVLSNPDKALKAIQAAIKVIRNTSNRSARAGTFLAALTCLFSACQPGNVLSNTKVGHVMAEKYSSVAELASASSSELDEIINFASDSIKPKQDNSPQPDNHKKVQYPAGNTITIMLTDLGKFDSEYSTNESMKTYRQLESVARIDGCDTEYLGRIKIVIRVIDPSDSVNMNKIKSHGSSTAVTDGLSMVGDVPIIPINSIPIPNTESLANLLSHEIKHPFPFIVANILRTRHENNNQAPKVPSGAYKLYTAKLDSSEKIDKTKSVWMITGTPLNPLDASVSTKCNILPKKKSEKEK